MLELVFDQSLAGSMKQAKGHPRGIQVSLGVKVYGCAEGECPTQITSGPERIKTVWDGAVLGGTRDEIAPLCLGLHLGDLSSMESTDVSPRKEELRRLNGPWENRVRDTTEKYWEETLETMARLRQAVETGELVRIWATPWNPNEICGLCYACHLLRDGTNLITWVRPPREIASRNGAVERVYGLGQFESNQLGDLAAAAIELTPEQRRAFADRWLELAAENAPLRTMVNGKLVGVAADYYDEKILEQFPVGDVKKMGVLIAELLREVPWPGDVWFWRRVMNFVEQGRVQVLEAAGEHPYSATIRRCW